MIRVFAGAVRSIKSVTALNLFELMNSQNKQLAVVIGLVKDAQGKILLQKRIDSLIPSADGKWELPGGRIDYGETPEQALIREFAEETGCVISVKKLLPIIQSSIWERSDGGEQQALVMCYEAEYLSGKPEPLDKKVSEVRWFSSEEIKSLDLLRGVNDFIKLSEE